MSDRILIWHIPVPGSPTPVYYADRDYEAAALRIYANRTPELKDLIVDILDDSVSIMNGNSYQKLTFKDEDGYIEFGTPSGTFSLNEVVTGGTSGATGRVKANVRGKLTLYDISATAYSAGETITGDTSSATGVVGTYVRPIKRAIKSIVPGQSHATLPKGKNANEAAQDFRTSIEIAEGSWISLSQVELAGASDITVQLELKALASNVEKRPWAGGDV